MHPRRPSGRACRLARARIGRLGWLAVLVTVAAAGCANSGAAHPGPATKARVTPCGTAKTAAAVPVKVEVIKGQIACAAAMAVERAYAAAIRSGRAPGNGGGRPGQIKGRTRPGFATPARPQTRPAAPIVPA